MPPEGFHTVRSHIRRNPRPKAKRLSGWTIAALVAGIWLWGQIFGFGETEPAGTGQPKPSASAPAEP